MTYELCPHGRHIGAVCLPCEEEKLIYGTNPDYEYVDPYDILPKRVEEREPNGLDSPYYDLPGNILDCQDLIEWLGLDFSNGNILKSLVREHNPDGGKETDALYEAEKRFYFASRHLERVRNMQKKKDRRKEHSPGTEEGLEDESD